MDNNDKFIRITETNGFDQYRLNIFGRYLGQKQTFHQFISWTPELLIDELSGKNEKFECIIRIPEFLTHEHAALDRRFSKHLTALKWQFLNAYRQGFDYAWVTVEPHGS